MKAPVLPSKPIVLHDGLNLSLEHGTGIATYTRALIGIERDIGYDPAVVYSLPVEPAKNPVVREIQFFDVGRKIHRPKTLRYADIVRGQVSAHLGVKPKPLSLGGTVVANQFAERLPQVSKAYVAHDLWSKARIYFARTGKFLELEFDEAPAIYHMTYPMPLKVKGAVNTCTIHDIVPLRLPFATADNKGPFYRMLRKMVQEFDHIITISEHSRNDIIEVLDCDPAKVTNCFLSVEVPEKLRARPADEVAMEVEGLYGLTPGGYFLFFGAIEPKKNVMRLIEAHLSAQLDIPLVVVSSGGWANEREKRMLASAASKARTRDGRPRLIHLDYAPYSQLVSLIRCARAVTFPSLYEGFGLPVLEAMQLGTPVLTSTTSSLPEVAGDAAVMADAYDVASIAAGLRQLAHDDALCAELARRGPVQAARFSMEAYRDRIRDLYGKLV